MSDIKLKGMTQEEVDKIVPSNTILLGYAGSISHGTQIVKNDPYSIGDIDIMGAYVAPKNVYLGLERFYTKKFEQREVKYDVYDSVIYEIQKFVFLLIKQNPNVVGLLWLRPEDYIYISKAGKSLIDNRDLFISRKAYHSFTGYAYSQLYKMEHNACEGYMGRKRKELVEKFGYDCKNAAHLIRLLRMGIEFLNEGKFNVFRNDADELKEIKTGKWSLEKVKKEADNLFLLSKEAFDKSSLPPEPNYRRAEDLLIEIVQSQLGMDGK